VEAWREREARMPATVAEQRLLIEQLQAQLKAGEEARCALAQERDLLKKSLPSHLVALFQRKRSTR
jgi:predicted  nucleic acid-binding Zn-ribbon protein